MALLRPEPSEEVFTGIPFAGVDPDPRLEGATDLGRHLWGRFELTLPPTMQGLLSGRAVDPWTDRPRRRSGAVGLLAETFRDLAADRMEAVQAGELTLLEWRDELVDDGLRMIVAAAQVQFGGTRVLDDELTVRRLSATLQQLDARVTALATRAALPEDDPDHISLAQARAWAGQSGRGLIRSAGQMAAAAHFGDEPVRRVMTAYERHCLTCPGKAKTFANIELAIEYCGGWPGDGSDECHGNCLCTIEPARLTSVYRDPRRELVPVPPREPEDAGERLFGVARYAEVRDDDDVTVQEHIRHLLLLPLAVHQALQAAGLQIRIGAGTVTSFPEGAHLTGRHPRGWPAGTTWDDAPGGYRQATSTVMAGTGGIGHQSVSLSLHETGHAVGHLLGHDDDPELGEHHRRLFSRLTAYERQGGAGGRAGRQELLAEGIASVLMNEEAARNQYDDAFVDWIKGILGIP